MKNKIQKFASKLSDIFVSTNSINNSLYGYSVYEEGREYSSPSDRIPYISPIINKMAKRNKCVVFLQALVSEYFYVYYGDCIPSVFEICEDATFFIDKCDELCCYDNDMYYNYIQNDNAGLTPANLKFKRNIQNTIPVWKSDSNISFETFNIKDNNGEVCLNGMVISLDDVMSNIK